MPPAIAAILWTALVLLWIRPGWLGGIIVTLVLIPVFHLLSSLPIEFLQQWPMLRPSSVPAVILACVLFAGTVVYRFRHARQ